MITISIQSLNQTKKKLTVVSSDVINSRIDEIKELFGYEENDIKLIFTGKVLDPNMTFAHYGISSNTCLILHKVPKKNRPIEPIPMQTSLPPPPIVNQSNNMNVPIPTPQPLISSLPRYPMQSIPMQLGNIQTHTTPVGNLQTQVFTIPFSMENGNLLTSTVQTMVQNMVQNLYQTPQQPNTTQNVSYWRTEMNEDDTTERYSFEQILAILPMFYALMAQNNFFALGMINNPNTALESIFTNTSQQTLLRNLLDRSQHFADEMRNGTTFTTNNITEMLRNNQNINNNNEDINDEDEEDNDDDNEDDDNDEEENVNTNTDGQVELTDDDVEIIEQIMTIGNVSRNDATQMYIVCGRNFNTTMDNIFALREMRDF